MQNTVYENPNYYSSVDQFHCANNHNIEPLPYLDPVKTIGRIVNDDYEALPKLDDDDVHYEYPTESFTMQSSTLSVGEALPEDKQIYEDPGHIKEKIYELFKQRNIRKLDKNSVR